jgi:hypothetical protein
MPAGLANLGTTVIASPPAPPTTGLSLKVAPTTGAWLAKAIPGYFTIKPGGEQATPANAEIVHVASRAGDTLTIDQRGARETTPREVLAGDIISASIGDWTFEEREEHAALVTVTGTTTLAPPSTASLIDLLMKASATVKLPAPVATASYLIQVRQDTVGGRELVFSTPSGSIFWEGGVAPSWSVPAGARDLVSFICLDGVNYLGVFVGKEMK